MGEYIHVSLADLDELVLACRDDKAKSYIAEAVACYKVGAYRQCIVATWIAVVYDIIHKLQELELTGDKNAAKKNSEYLDVLHGKDMDKALEFERRILDIAKNEFELLSEIEWSDLVRIREDRHRCAHPSMNKVNEIYQPAPELARTHIRNAVNHMLRWPPVQGRSALARLEREVASDYFPNTVEGARSQFNAGPLLRPRVSLVRNFGDILIKSLLLGGYDPKQKQKYFVAFLALRDLQIAVVNQLMLEKLNEIMLRVDDDALAVCLEFLDKIPDTWQFLGENMQTKLDNFVCEMPDHDMLSSIVYALRLTELKKSAEKRIMRATPDQLLEISNRITDEFWPTFGDYVIELLTKVESSQAVNYIVTNLIDPWVMLFTVDQIERLVQIANSNALVRKFNERESLFTAIRNSGRIDKKELDNLIDMYGFEEDREDYIPF